MDISAGLIQLPHFSMNGLETTRFHFYDIQGLLLDLPDHKKASKISREKQ